MSEQPTEDGFLVPPGMTEAINRYFEENAPIAMAWFERMGLARDEPDRQPTRRDRLRNTLHDLRQRAARLAYRVIAGDWPDNGEDDW